MASHKRKRMDNDAEDAAPAPRSTQVVNLSTQVVNLKGRKPQKINTGEDGWKLQRSRWHNPFTAKQCGGSRAKCVLKYLDYLLQQNSPGAALLADVASLRGKRLACWCAPDLCHGQVLARLAEGADPKEVRVWVQRAIDTETDMPTAKKAKTARENRQVENAPEKKKAPISSNKPENQTPPKTKPCDSSIPDAAPLTSRQKSRPDDSTAAQDNHTTQDDDAKEREARLERAKSKIQKRLAQVKQQRETHRIKQLMPAKNTSRSAPPFGFKQQSQRAAKQGRCLKIEEQVHGILFERKVFIPLHTKKSTKERILDVLKRGFKSSSIAATKLEKFDESEKQRASLSADH